MRTYEKQEKFFDKSTILWVIPIVFFFIMSFFLLPIMQPGLTILYSFIPFGAQSGFTILAWYIYKRHYSKIEIKPFYLPTLIYIPLTFGFIILFEATFNASRLFEPGFIESHFQYHIFNDTFAFVTIFFAMWLFFQKNSVGKKSILFSYVLGAIFEAFFAGESGSGGGGIIMGFLWIWILHINWFFTSLLIRER